ncbi:fatty acid desaturase [Dongia mobilis]|uniref:Fatty acid desaturase n=1 Tax=Dongia mobilis TaxID=578943 RepID=A0A4R6WYT5_9PROT|nr:fatty acid desaturase [Dongia mobilis]TDQ84623.1 fatty acid desaturase [Dongia mobilis]
MAESTANDAAFYRRLNIALLAGYGGAAMAAYFLLPLLIHRQGVTWAWLLLPLVLASNGYWATLHEAIHGQLLTGAGANRRAGRVLAILWGSSFRLLRFGHLMHHRFNRHALDRPDCYDPARDRPAAARLRFYGEILGGLYLLELLTPLLYLLPRTLVEGLVARVYAGDEGAMPRLRQLALQTLAGAEGVAEIRRDALLAWGLILLALWAWGAYWPAFALFLIGRGLLVSLTDNVYHYATPLDRVEFAYNLRLPRPLQALFLNMNMHRVHHRHMQAPWWQLPHFFAADRDGYDGSFMRGLARQARGPVPAASARRDTPA